MKAIEMLRQIRDDLAKICDAAVEGSKPSLVGKNNVQCMVPYTMSANAYSDVAWAWQEMEWLIQDLQRQEDEANDNEDDDDEEDEQ